MKWPLSIFAAAAVLFGAATAGQQLHVYASGDLEDPLALSVKKDIVEAVIFAASLDQQLWENKDEFDTKQKVLDHYRQGFSEDIAEMFTEYWWWDMKGKLLPGDPLLAPPDEVVVGKYSDDKAEAYYETPQILRDPDTWGLDQYIYVELERRGDRWIVVKAVNKDSKPF